MMEVAQSWRLKFSFRNATIVVCLLNVLTALLLLQGFLSSYSSRNKITVSQFNSGLSLSLSIFVILLEISLSINWNCSWVLNVFPNYVINLWTFLAFCVTRLRKSNGFFSNWTEMNCWYLDLVVDQLGGPFFNLKF